MKHAYLALPLAAALVAVPLPAPAAPAKPAAARPVRAPLSTLRPGHPRLFADAAGIEALRARIAGDAQIRGLATKLRAKGALMLEAPVVKRDMSEGHMLEEARRALRRVAALALLWRLDGDAAARDRAIRELHAIADLPDWNPAHFLDTAELTLATAIGYDWLHDQLDAPTRAKLARAIADKGLAAGLKAYREADFWVGARHNWGLVCNAGLIVGALAIGDTHPALAATAIDEAKHGFIRAADHFAPDGGWDEGPGYWRYGANYAAYAIAALDGALGDDLGLWRPGLAKAGAFGMHVAGPTGKAFNFGDASEHGLERAPALFWLARRAKQPAWAVGEWARAAADTEAFHLLWAPDERVRMAPPHPDARFRGAEVATFRSGWIGPRHAFLAVKGGDNAANHSHLDLGSFVFDAAGVRWASDLGPDSYGLPGYFLGYIGSQRYSYYRLGTHGHNTLTIDGQNQATTAVAPIVAYKSTPKEAGATIDLTAAYPGAVTRALRRFTFKDRRTVVVEDAVELQRPADVVWHMHTRAAIAIQGDRATLTQAGETLEARILAPAGLRFEARPAAADQPRKGEGTQPDVQDLVVAGRMDGKTRLAIELKPTGKLRE